MFSSNDTPEEEFKYANEIGGIINLDDITHIKSLEKAVGYIPKVISCRYNPGGVFKISNDIMDNPGDAKYGMTTEQIFEAFKTLKAKGAEEFGIHSFLASNTVTNDYYPMLAKELFELAVKLQKETGHSLQSLSLAYFFHQPFQTVPVTGVSNLNQLKDALAACDIDFEPELFGGWVTDGGDR